MSHEITAPAALIAALAQQPVEREQFADGVETEAAATEQAERAIAEYLDTHFAPTQLGLEHGHSVEHFAEGIVETIICELDAENRFSRVGAVDAEWSQIARQVVARAGVVLADFHRNPEPCELRWMDECADPDRAARYADEWPGFH